MGVTMLEETPQVSGARQISDLVTQSAEGCSLVPRRVGTTCRVLRGAVRLATIAVTGLALAVASAHAGTKILQNDGFTGIGLVVCQLGAAEGDILAARFSADPGDYPFTIEEVHVMVCPAGPTGFFVLHVWEDDGVSLQPGSLLYSDLYQLTGSASSLNSIDLRLQNIVITSGSVRIGLELFQNYPPSLPRDDDGTITSGANFVYDFPTSTWWPSELIGLTGDWIIRLQIQTPDASIFTDGFESGDTTAWSSAVP